MTPVVKRGAGAILSRGILNAASLTTLLMLVAGRWDWIWGWVMAVIFGGAAAAQRALVPTKPALPAERSQAPRERGAPLWDRTITSLAFGLFPFAAWVLSALHARFEWSPSMPLALHIGGTIVFALGWLLVLWATSSNRFFTTTVVVRRDQTVQMGGPYRFVRHPGYVGALLYNLATPFLLGSWWAMIPMLLIVPLMVLRTALEDRTLQAELPGYKEYARSVPYRLVPAVW